MKKNILFGATISLILFNACEPNPATTNEKITQQETATMTNTPSPLISLFEIPATDISRAITFYEKILDIDIEQMDMEGMKMGIFPYENQPVTGILVEMEGSVPSSNGSVIYFNAGNDLQLVLDKVEKNGGQLLVPKTMHADESGYFAILLDTEGNKIGLNSPN